MTSIHQTSNPRTTQPRQKTTTEPKTVNTDLNTDSEGYQSPDEDKKRGRKPLTMEQSSPPVKIRKVNELSREQEEAFEQLLRDFSAKYQAHIRTRIHTEVLNADREILMYREYKDGEKVDLIEDFELEKKLSKAECLALFLDAKCTYEQWDIFHSRCPDIYYSSSTIKRLLSEKRRELRAQLLAVTNNSNDIVGFCFDPEETVKKYLRNNDNLAAVVNGTQKWAEEAKTYLPEEYYEENKNESQTRTHIRNELVNNHVNPKPKQKKKAKRTKKSKANTNETTEQINHKTIKPKLGGLGSNGIPSFSVSHRQKKIRISTYVKLSSDAHAFFRANSEVLQFMNFVAVPHPQEFSNHMLVGAYLCKDTSNDYDNACKYIEERVFDLDMKEVNEEFRLPLEEVKKIFPECEIEADYNVIVTPIFVLGGDLKQLMLDLRLEDDNEKCVWCMLLRALRMSEFTNDDGIRPELVLNAEQDPLNCPHEMTFDRRQPPQYDGQPFIRSVDNKRIRPPNVRLRFSSIGYGRRVPDVLHLKMRLAGWWVAVLYYVAVMGGKGGSLLELLHNVGAIPHSRKPDDNYWSLDGKQSTIMLKNTTIDNVIEHIKDSGIDTEFVENLHFAYQQLSIVINQLNNDKERFWGDDAIRGWCRKVNIVVTFVSIIHDGMTQSILQATGYCPYYLHILNTHVVSFLYYYRTLAPFSMQGHEGLNKAFKRIWNRNSNCGGGVMSEKEQIFATVNETTIAADRNSKTLFEVLTRYLLSPQLH